MLPPIPYRPFTTRIILRSVVIWIGVRAFVSGLAGGVVLEWQAALMVGALVGGLSYGDAVRCHEPLFLGNCGVPRSSLVLLAFGAAFALEVVLFAGYTTWIAF